MKGAKAKMLRRIARGGDKELPERKYQPVQIHHLIALPVVERRTATRTRYVARAGRWRKETIQRESLAGHAKGGQYIPVPARNAKGEMVTQPDAVAAPYMLDPECTKFVHRHLKRLYGRTERRLRSEAEFVSNVLA